MLDVIITCSNLNGFVLDSTRVQLSDDVQSLAIVPLKIGEEIPSSVGSLEVNNVRT